MTQSIHNISEDRKWYVRKALFYSFFFIEHMFWIFVRIASLRRFSQISKIYVAWRFYAMFLHNFSLTVTFWAELSWHSNCHYNEFCRYIECRYKEGWLYKQGRTATEDLETVNRRTAHVYLSFLFFKERHCQTWELWRLHCSKERWYVSICSVRHKLVCLWTTRPFCKRNKTCINHILALGYIRGLDTFFFMLNSAELEFFFCY